MMNTGSDVTLCTVAVLNNKTFAVWLHQSIGLDLGCDILLWKLKIFLGILKLLIVKISREKHSLNPAEFIGVVLRSIIQDTTCVWV